MTTMNLHVDFSARPQVRPFLARLAGTSGLAVNIVRGRMTPTEARYEIELRGSRRKLARALRESRWEGIDLRIQDNA